MNHDDYEDPDIERLAKLCGMLSSDAGGERASAALMATKQLKKMGLTWEDIVQSAFSRTDARRDEPRAGQRPHYGGPRPKQRHRSTTHQGVEIRKALEIMDIWIRTESHLFSDRDRDFIQSIRLQGAEEYGLTPAQWPWMINLLIRVQKAAEAA